MAQRNANKADFTPLPHGQVKPFKVEFETKDLDELRQKLDWVRWGPESLLYEEEAKKNPGLLPTQELLKSLVEKWKLSNFQKMQETINKQPNFLVEIDWCKPLHFIHKKSSRKDAIPLLLIHGWPGSFFEFYFTIDKLCEPENEQDQAFHVVIPSLPGYAWSKGPPTKAQGVGDVDGYSRILDTLMMDVLGYEAYASQGGDWGSVHARCLGAKFARPDGKTGCRAVHLNFSPIVPQWVWAVKALPEWIVSAARERLPGEIGANVRKLDGFYNSMAYYWIQQHRPQQLATGLIDSPVGLLSWLSFFWGLQIGTTPSFSEESMLTICTVYFITRSIGTSFLPYHTNNFLPSIHGDSAYKINQATLGYSDYPKEITNTSQAWLKGTGNLRFYAKAPKGGHFAALEVPDIFVNHLRTAFANHDDAKAKALNKDKSQLESLDIHSAHITGSLWPSHLRSQQGSSRL